jgi:hypothetical protein
VWLAGIGSRASANHQGRLAGAEPTEFEAAQYPDVEPLAQGRGQSAGLVPGSPPPKSTATISSFFVQPGSPRPEPPRRATAIRSGNVASVINEDGEAALDAREVPLLSSSSIR